MELFDILDKNGKPTGLTVTRGTQLLDGQFYLGVHAYIFNSRGEFLLQQRAYDKAFLPGGWDVVLEHVIAGETSTQGVIRGVAEEIGLCISENDILSSWRMVWDEFRHIVDVYFVKSDFDITKLNLGRTEVIGAKFVSREEMLTHVSNMHYRPKKYRKHVAQEIMKLNEMEVIA